MGCLDCLKPPIPQEVLDAVEKIATKAGEIANTCLTEKSNIEQKKNSLLAERAEKIGAADKGDTGGLEKLLLEYNKKEIEIEKDFIANEADKMHQIYKIGLEFAGPARDATTKMLDEQLAKANDLVKKGLQSKLNEVKQYTPKQFLDSMYGKPLLTALENQGMSQKLLETYKKELLDDRTQRRKEERGKFSIAKNEFPPEDDLNFVVKDVFDAVISEYQGNFVEHVRNNLLK